MLRLLEKWKPESRVLKVVLMELSLLDCSVCSRVLGTTCFELKENGKALWIRERNLSKKFPKKESRGFKCFFER